MTFEDYLKTQGVSASSRALYVRIGARVAADDPAAWFQGQVERNLAVGTLLPLRSAVGYLLAWQKGIPVAEARLALVKAKGRKTVPREGLAPAGLDAYEAAARSADEPFRTLLLLLPYTGLRISEACALRTEDVRKGPPAQLHVLGKGQKERAIPLPDTAVRLLLDYRKGFLAGLSQDVSQWLFPGRTGRPVNPQEVRKVLRTLRERHPEMGLSTSPHVLRHTFATRIVERGANLGQAQKLLGHEDVGTTTRYTHPSMEALHDAVKKLD